MFWIAIGRATARPTICLYFSCKRQNAVLGKWLTARVIVGHWTFTEAVTECFGSVVAERRQGIEGSKAISRRTYKLGLSTQNCHLW